MVMAKKVTSILMVVITIISSFSMLFVSASAATSAKKNVVSYSAVSGGTVSSRKNTFTVKANFWTKRKITIYGQNSFPNKETLNAFSKLAKFDIVVKDKNGKTVGTYNNKSLGFSFTLPKWQKNNYTIIVTSKFVGYNRGSAYHQAAALSGKYYLSY